MLKLKRKIILPHPLLRLRNRKKVAIDRRIAFAIPNLFTVASLICALVALNQASTGFFIQAAWLVTISMILDGFDGKMARMLNATSHLGAQADSLADFVAFGVVPGFLAWQVYLHEYGFLGFAVFILYVLCGGFRLARFNVMNTVLVTKKDFMGLPIPAAAATVCSFILFNKLVLQEQTTSYLLVIIMICSSFLMISNIPYIAINKKPKKRKYYIVLACLVPVFIMLAVRFTVWVYFIFTWTYIVFGLYNMTKILINRHHDKLVYKKTREF